MFSFRKKILITYAVLFIVFTSATFPIVTRIVSSIAAKTMEDRADELIAKVASAPNNEALVRRLKEQKPLTFFRVSVVSDAGKILYDSHARNLMGPRFSQEHVIDHPEVIEAFAKGIGYTEDFSELQDQKFSYFAKAFNFHGKKYVVRIAFPYQYFSDLADNFEIAFLVLIISLLLLFSALTWIIINNLTSPIQQIITAANTYDEGVSTTVPAIRLNPASAKGEFGQLAMTLNSLSNKIQKHIDNLTAERNEKEAILESLVEGVVAVDGEMRVTYANSMAIHLLNLELKGLCGHHFSEAQEPQSYALLQSCQNEKKLCTGSSMIMHGNTKIYLDIVAAPIGGGLGAILVMQDKSSHYRLLEMRKDFIANASHELKTPITIIRGFAEMLHDNPELPLSITEEITAKIVKNCHRMTGLITDLLTLSDIENIPLSRLTECNLFDIIQLCCDTVQNIYPDAKITLNVPTEEEFVLQMDPSLMELAFINLIQNAAKYSLPPAIIDLSLRKVDGQIEITVADQGIGIPKEDLEHIFERFYTVNKAHSKKLGGSGLGLSIVQTIIHKHFGQISVESALGQGTIFTIRF
ncbi:MAG: ATP-binding protein [Parachlamydiaceae bacterium]